MIDSEPPLPLGVFMNAEVPRSPSDPPVPMVRFGAFELDIRAGELRKHGLKIRLQEQPFQVLLMLLRHPGEVVLREEIRKRLWPNDTIVEFAHSINAAIQRLRDALGDSADQPRYVETVARRGYRFIGELIPLELGPALPQLPADESIPNLSDLSGHTLAHYRVYERLGRGGMGEVYRARDTKLGRDVALKVLPQEFAQNADRMARFEREAQVLASLNHPNIAAIYGVEEANGIRALVMELVEGPTLAERILRGAIPLEEALRIAQQITDALEAAHEKGIVHRDLKPANIKVSQQGVVKVLDFGLAMVAPDSVATLDDPENSVTPAGKLSQAGAILGTASHMAPEQARGESVDKRADIWAFGVVLYEMLTGRRLFEGANTTEVLSEVVSKEPSWDGVPVRVRRLLRSCLEKDPRRRLRDIADAWRLVEDGPQELAPARPSLARMAVALFLAVAVLVFAFSYLRRGPEETRVFKLSVPPPERAKWLPFTPVVVSPDGRHVAFVATTDGRYSLWVRDLDSLAARTLARMDEDEVGTVFWSPDSHFVAFVADGKLKKIDVAGGPAVSLCDARDSSYGGTWSKNNIILSYDYGGLVRVSAAGGSPTTITEIDRALGERVHAYPWFLPDGHHFVYTALSTDPDKSAVYVADLDSKTRRRVLAANSNAIYSPPGYLLYLRAGTLMAQPFDAGNARTNGDPIPAAEPVDYDNFSNYGTFSASQNGLLIYASGAVRDEQLTWFDRSGRVLGTVGEPAIMEVPTVSPDGNTVASDQLDPATGFYDLWLHHLKRGTTSRFTFNSKTNDSPIWSPDGSHIVFRSTRDGGSTLYQKAIGSVSQDELVDNSIKERVETPDDWSPDGRYIISTISKGLWVSPLFGDRKPFPYFQSEFAYGAAKLSPNGRWLAYAAEETGRGEIYVEGFPTHAGKWQISTGGGDIPVWSWDGKELFFAEPDRKIMVVEVKAGDKFEASVPKLLFAAPIGPNHWFDVSKDGRFLIPTPVEQSANVAMIVAVNWVEGLKK